MATTKTCMTELQGFDIDYLNRDLDENKHRYISIEGEIYFVEKEVNNEIS